MHHSQRFPGNNKIGQIADILDFPDISDQCSATRSVRDVPEEHFRKNHWYFARVCVIIHH